MQSLRKFFKYFCDEQKAENDDGSMNDLIFKRCFPLVKCDKNTMFHFR